MSDRDAYPDEMTTPFGPTDDELEGVYAGTAPTEQFEQVAAFMLEVKMSCSAAPEDNVANQQVAAMIEEARRLQPARPLTQQTVVPAERNRWRRALDKTVSLALKGAAGMVAASMSMMGLAYAGVNLPGQAAEQALEAVTGVELPNQDGEDNANSVAEDVKAVVEGDTEKGCEFGQAVATAASQNAQGERSGEHRCTDAGDEETDRRGSKATGDEKSAQGRATAAEKSAQGRATATEKSEGASDAGADNATRGSDRASAGSDNASTGTERAAAGSDNASTGMERAAAGSGNAPTAEDEDEDEDDGGMSGRETAGEQSGGPSTAGASNAASRP